MVGGGGGGGGRGGGGGSPIYFLHREDPPVRVSFSGSSSSFKDDNVTICFNDTLSGFEKPGPCPTENEDNAVWHLVFVNEVLSLSFRSRL